MKTILITGATDGIGLLTATKLVKAGHKVLIHGRNADKLASAMAETGAAESYLADMSDMSAVETLAAEILSNHNHLDALINNAGVYKTSAPRSKDGIDLRFVVNTFAPYHLTQRLLPIMPADGRIVNLSSAAQAPIDLDAMVGKKALDDFAAYAQSKLAITIWTQELARSHTQVFAAVNPGSLLASKMVKEGFGVAGNDLNIGADILIEATTGDRFASASGQYYDNDGPGFSAAHDAASDQAHVKGVMAGIKQMTAALL